MSMPTFKFEFARLGEGIFFFVMIPALLFFMLLHMSEGSIYLLVAGQKLTLAATAEDFIQQFPNYDISHQLKFAVDYVRDGSVADWVLNLWPPGMPVLYSLILQLSGSDHFPLKIITLSALLYSLASYFVYRSIAPVRFSPTALLASIFPLVYASFKNSIILDMGLFSSDFFCFALLAILLSLLFRVEDRSFIRLAQMAIIFAALAYFRSFYFIFIKLLTVVSLFFLVTWAVYAASNRGWRATIQNFVQCKAATTVGMVLLLTWVLLLPWKVYLEVNEKNFEWTVTDQVWAAQWRNDLPPFLVGMNTPCILENDICEQLMPFQYPDTWATPKLGSDFYKRLSIATFVSSPIKWYGEKTKVFNNLWFDEKKLNRKMTAPQLLQYMVSAGLLVTCFYLAFLTVVRSVYNVLRHRSLIKNNGLYLLFTFFCLYNLLVFTFVHYEPRYSIPLKWVTYLFLLFVLKDIMYKFDLRLTSHSTRRGAL